MSYSLEYSEGQRDYLERIGVGPLLESFVADAVREKPNDIYQFLEEWASARCRNELANVSVPAVIVAQRAVRRHLAQVAMRTRQKAVRERVERRCAREGK
ncbi:hypothetical protein ERJ75_000252300 [Trypanosoma vivax]|nr:hypothetical protein ERJ75_000252300 [Trypanosoma vivax]